MMSKILVCIILLGFTGCASNRIQTSQRRGLFQNPSGSGVEKYQAIESEGPKAQVLVPGKAGYIWPIENAVVSSKFGKRRRDFHDGIDIRASRGTPVHAAKQGIVIYSSRKIKGYGNMIVVKHPDNSASVYAHNKKNLVKRGDYVKQGQVIAHVGATGKATGPHLHFEIRKNEVPQDPMLFLPQLHEVAESHADVQLDANKLSGIGMKSKSN